MNLLKINKYCINGPASLVYQIPKVEPFYIVSARVNDVNIEFIRLLKQFFELELYSNFKVQASSDFIRFKFSEAYPYSVFSVNLVNRFPVGGSLVYFIFFYLIDFLINLDSESCMDLGIEVSTSLQTMRNEFLEISDFFYFVGFGVDKLISYNEFFYFNQFIMININKVSANSVFIINFFRNLCYLIVFIRKFG